MRKKIFLSYAQEDTKYVEKVVEQLRAKGILSADDSILLDPGFSKMKTVPHLSSGPIPTRGAVRTQGAVRTRGAVTRRTLQAADQVVLFWTEAGMKSQWVNYEAGMAEALGKSIIAVVVGEASPKLPSSLSNIPVLRIE